ncbi:MAG TPA: hypothetical protein VF147_08535 [Vicinamibacterales bacterium]
MKLTAYLVVAAVTIAGCGGRSPVAPESPSSIVVLGPQVLRITPMASCALPRGVLPMLYTRVTVSRSGDGWVAVAAKDSGGDVQVRFRSTGGINIQGTMRVVGTITGTVVHMPDLLSVPTGDVRAEFTQTAALEGVAFTAGALNASTAGLDGLGTGAFSVIAPGTDASCSATSFSWSIFPPQQ